MVSSGNKKHNQPLSYEEHNYQQLFLFHKLRGVAVAELAHCVFGLHSIETTWCHIVMKPLIALPRRPTLPKMLDNLNHTFSTPSGSLAAYLGADW